MEMNEMDKKQENKNTKKKKINIIINTVLVVVMLILIAVQMACGFRGASKYVYAAFDPCVGLILGALVLRSDCHGLRRAILIIITLIVFVVRPLIYILAN